MAERCRCCVDENLRMYLNKRHKTKTKRIQSKRIPLKTVSVYEKPPESGTQTPNRFKDRSTITGPRRLKSLIPLKLRIAQTAKTLNEEKDVYSNNSASFMSKLLCNCNLNSNLSCRSCSCKQQMPHRRRTYRSRTINTSSAVKWCQGVLCIQSRETTDGINLRVVPKNLPICDCKKCKKRKETTKNNIIKCWCHKVLNRVPSKNTQDNLTENKNTLGVPKKGRGKFVNWYQDNFQIDRSKQKMKEAQPNTTQQNNKDCYEKCATTLKDEKRKQDKETMQKYSKQELARKKQQIEINKLFKNTKKQLEIKSNVNDQKVKNEQELKKIKLDVMNLQQKIVKVQLQNKTIQKIFEKNQNNKKRVPEPTCTLCKAKSQQMIKKTNCFLKTCKSFFSSSTSPDVVSLESKNSLRTPKRNKRRPGVIDTSSAVRWCRCLLRSQSEKIPSGIKLTIIPSNLSNCDCKKCKKCKTNKKKQEQIICWCNKYFDKVLTKNQRLKSEQEVKGKKEEGKQQQQIGEAGKHVICWCNKYFDKVITKSQRFKSEQENTEKKERAKQQQQIGEAKQHSEKQTRLKRHKRRPGVIDTSSAVKWCQAMYSRSEQLTTGFKFQVIPAHFSKCYFTELSQIEKNKEGKYFKNHKTRKETKTLQHETPLTFPTTTAERDIACGDMRTICENFVTKKSYDSPKTRKNNSITNLQQTIKELCQEYYDLVHKYKQNKQQQRQENGIHDFRTQKPLIDAYDKEGEPLFALRLNSVDMSILNPTETLEKIKQLGKTVPYRGSCVCSYHKKLRSKYKTDLYGRIEKPRFLKSVKKKKDTPREKEPYTRNKNKEKSDFNSKSIQRHVPIENNKIKRTQNVLDRHSINRHNKDEIVNPNTIFVHKLIDPKRISQAEKNRLCPCEPQSNLCNTKKSNLDDKWLGRLPLGKSLHKKSQIQRTNSNYKLQRNTGYQKTLTKTCTLGISLHNLFKDDFAACPNTTCPNKGSKVECPCERSVGFGTFNKLKNKKSKTNAYSDNVKIKKKNKMMKAEIKEKEKEKHHENERKRHKQASSNKSKLVAMKHAQKLHAKMKRKTMLTKRRQNKKKAKLRGSVSRKADKEFARKLKSENQTIHEMQRKEYGERKKREKELKKQFKSLQAQSKGKEEQAQTSFFADCVLGTLGFIFEITINALIILFRIITKPKQSLTYMKIKLNQPLATFKKVKQWLSDYMAIKKLKIENSMAGSETMTILSDTLQATACYQAFIAKKGKTKEERRDIARENEQRRKRNLKRDQVVVGCRNTFLSTLRKRPCLWVYHVCPNFYPQCLSCLGFYRQLIELSLFCLAVLFWTPCLAAVEMFRFFVCCGLCTA